MKKARRWRALLAGSSVGTLLPVVLGSRIGEEQRKENQRGGRYEGHDEREAGREKQEAAGAPVRSCECASRGGRIAQDRTRKALRADCFSARPKSRALLQKRLVGVPAEAVPFQSNESRSARCPRSTPRPTPSVVGTPVLFAKVGRAENGALNNHPKESSVSAEDRASLAVRLRCLGVRCEGNRGERGYGGTGRSFTPSLSRRSKPSVLADRGSKSA